ncbi:non-structural maintenance of chromosomes element 1 homolog isoform X2 [Babylonia areolata]|uniref:non-structural maintenance of chromosomes element 1 homolog isoform X2 n=1 Tax=Babylonia areolata TaxID=304850 RepID=UPI003FD0BEF9
MNQAHKAFLQAFMTKSVQKGKEVKELYKHCCEQYSEPYSSVEQERNQQMVTFIRTINTEILPFHLEVKKGICEQDSTNYYCLVNNVENNITRLSSDYTANELEFFKKLVEMIVETEGCVGSRAALNIVERLDKKMLKQDAEYLLERLCSEQWILQKEGKVSLSVRSILELNQYIQQVYPDSVKVCNICNLIVLKNQAAVILYLPHRLKDPHARGEWRWTEKPHKSVPALEVEAVNGGQKFSVNEEQNCVRTKNKIMCK